MKFKVVIVAVFLFLGLDMEGASLAKHDSISVKKVGSRAFILHRIDQKETLYRLSIRYDVSMDHIVEHNPKAELGLHIGDTLLIPYISLAKNTKHIVASKETLYSIAKKYLVAVEDIKKWNKLESNDLALGQELIINPLQEEKVPTFKEKAFHSSNAIIHIVKKKETLYAIAKKYNVELDSIKHWNDMLNNNLDLDQHLIVGFKKHESMPVGHVTQYVKVTNPNPEPDTAITTTIDSQVKSYEKVVANGIAEVIKGSGDTKKFLALHKSAPVGTIIQVKNEMNNLSVFVRVIGNIPNTIGDEKVLIKISEKAYNRLGALDSRFPVEISYIPN